MSYKRGKETRRAESLRLRLSINEHMTSVGEEIVCVLDNQQNVGQQKRFVLERLGAAAGFIYDLVQREMETLETLLQRQDKLLDVLLQPRVILYRPGLLS